MSELNNIAVITVSIGFDGEQFNVKGDVDCNGAPKLANLAASAVSGAILPIVEQTTQQIAFMYGVMGEEIYGVIEKELDSVVVNPAPEGAHHE